MTIPDRLLAGDGSVVVPGRVARMLARPVAELVRSARYNGVRLDPELLAVVAAFERAGRQWAAARVAASIAGGTPLAERAAHERTMTGMDLTASQTADRLGCQPRNVRALASRRVITGRKVAGSWLLDPESVDAYSRRRSS